MNNAIGFYSTNEFLLRYKDDKTGSYMRTSKHG